MNIFVGLIIVVYIYFVSFKPYNCPDVQLRSPHPKTLEIAGSNPLSERSVLKLSAPEILQRPAPQPGAPLFGAPRPERPSAPANPGREKPPASLRSGGAGLAGRGPTRKARKIPCRSAKGRARQPGEGAGPAQGGPQRVPRAVPCPLGTAGPAVARPSPGPPPGADRRRRAGRRWKAQRVSRNCRRGARRAAVTVSGRRSARARSGASAIRHQAERYAASLRAPGGNCAMDPLHKESAACEGCAVGGRPALWRRAAHHAAGGPPGGGAPGSRSAARR